MSAGTNGTSIVASNPKQATLKDLLERATPALKQVLPRHLTADRLVKIALSATARDAKLLACTPQSILNSVMQASQLGLEPNSALGGCYLVPYGNTATLIVGYRGLIDLARRSGQIQSIEARVVHDNEKFRIVYGLDTVLEHEPVLDAEPGKVVAAYAIARLKDGAQQVEVMTRAQIDAIKGRSRSGTSGPWVTDYEEMARKTVVRRLCKYLPLSVEVAEAIETADRAESGEATAYAGVITINAEESDAPAASEPPAVTSGTPKNAAELVAKAKAKKSKNDSPADAGFDGAPAQQALRAVCEACSRYEDEGHQPGCPNGPDEP